MTNTSPTGRPTGELVLTVEGSRLTGNLATPKVSIDGTDHDSDYGPNRWELTAGTHRVKVWSPWMSGAGEAEATVEVPAGGSTSLFYSAPSFPGAPSRLGPVAHDRTGARVVTTMLVVLGVLLLLVLLGVLFAGGN